MTKHIKHSPISLCMILLLLFASCESKSGGKAVNQALELAGNNRIELEEVLKHYKNDPLKLKAAEFLIMNMPGSFARNKEIIEICTPFYDDYDSLARGPYLYAGLKKEVSFELFYWKEGWKSLKKQNGSNKHVVFNGVPKGALFLLRHQDINSPPGSRPFIYKNNEVSWH